MIAYDNGSQFSILLYMGGSVLPSSLPIGCCTFLLGLVLALLRELKPEWIVAVFEQEIYIADPFAIQTVAVVIGILLAMRTNMALGRWMDGISEIQTMLSKWCDANNCLNGFFSGKVGDDELEDRILLFRCRIAHWFSLMSALAFASLRSGSFCCLDDVPIKEIFSESQATKSFTTPRKYGSFRASDAGAPRLSVARSRDPDVERTKKQESIFSMSLSVLAAPSPEEVMRLELATDKVNCVCLWIVQGIISEIRSGTLDAPPPIVTRVFQELSIGMLGFNQALKVAMVPFPFPFAQMVSLLLAMLYCTLPFFTDVFTRNVIITPLISFLLPVCYSGLNTIAVELEEPFGTDFNDVDIEVRHEDFLWALTDTLRMPTIPPTSEIHGNKLLRSLARGCSYFQDELEKDGLTVAWRDEDDKGSKKMSEATFCPSSAPRYGSE